MGERLVDDTVQSAELTKVAVLAAESVTDQLRQAFRAPIAIEYKRDRHDPVTEHDRAAEHRIRQVILDEVPDSVIVGEEGGSHGAGDIRWYVDPIDGTANFAAGLPFWCTSIGVIVAGRIVAGVVLDHVRGDLFTASLQGAWCNGVRLQSAGAQDEASATILTSYPSPAQLAADGPVALKRFGAMVEHFASLRRPGSAALKLAHVAAGWTDVALGLSVNAWDVCAGILLVEQAGGRYHPLSRSGVPVESAWEASGYLAHVRTLDPMSSPVFRWLAPR